VTLKLAETSVVKSLPSVLYGARFSERFSWLFNTICLSCASEMDCSERVTTEFAAAISVIFYVGTCPFAQGLTPLIIYTLMVTILYQLILHYVGMH